MLEQLSEIPFSKKGENKHCVLADMTKTILRRHDFDERARRSREAGCVGVGTTILNVRHVVARAVALLFERFGPRES